MPGRACSFLKAVLDDTVADILLGYVLSCRVWYVNTVADDSVPSMFVFQGRPEMSMVLLQGKLLAVLVVRRDVVRSIELLGGRCQKA